MSELTDHRKTYICGTLSLAAILASTVLSTPESPEGIIFSYLAALLFILAFTHCLAKTRMYVLITMTSVLIFIISEILTNIFTGYPEGTLINHISEFFFLLAMFICPFGMVIGLVGMIGLYDKTDGND